MVRAIDFLETIGPDNVQAIVEGLVTIGDGFRKKLEDSPRESILRWLISREAISQLPLLFDLRIALNTFIRVHRDVNMPDGDEHRRA